jgi:uncharacterized protein YggE
MDNQEQESFTPAAQAPKKKLNIALDYRIIIIVLLIVIGAMLWLWKPWQSEPQTDRTISVTGQTTIKAEPDEFVFSPTYQFKNADKKAALQELSKKSDEITAKLKEIGVSDNHIKSNTGGYQDYYYYTNTNNTYTYNLSFTITADSKEQAQKVQDYLVTTESEGTISPNANFSDSKKKQLEDQARDQATKDARAKADQSAQNLGFKIVSVKSVNDGNNNLDNIYPRLFNGVSDLSQGTNSAESKLQVQPGENDLNYSVRVVYYIR